MAALPTTQTTGTVYWKIHTDYLPPGSTSVIAAPARGTVKIEPLRGSANFPTDGSSDLGVTLGYLTHFLRLDANGVIRAPLVADYAGGGWDYRVTPMLEVMYDDGKYMPAPPSLSTPFAFHLAPGATVDLADVRPLGLTGSGGVIPAPTATTVLRGQVASQAALPTGAATGDQYVTTDTYHLWQWTGSSWVDLGPTQSGSTSGSVDSTTVFVVTN